MPYYLLMSLFIRLYSMKKMKKLPQLIVLSVLIVVTFNVHAAGGSKASGHDEMPHGEPAKVGDAQAGKDLSLPCAACHGADGNSMIPDNPKLAGQGLAYINKQLHNFKSGARENALMMAQVANLTDKQMLDLATYFSKQEAAFATAQDNESLLVAERLYRAGDAGRNITACSACHGPAGRGNAPAKFPAIAGQHSKYIAGQLRAFRAVARGDHAMIKRANDPEGMMRDVVKLLTDDEIDALANYIQGLQL